MNAMDNHLERLLKAAAETPSLATPEPSFARKGRVLAHGRAARAQPRWFDFPGLLRHGLAWASVLALVTAVAGLAQIKRRAPDEWSLASNVANVTLTR
ncbi:MAG: hypothetical protein AAB676_10055 [Verrucomicrobiota bacterium]